MRTIIRSAVVTMIALLAILVATPIAEQTNIISRTSQGWLVGAASDSTAVFLGADGVGYLKVAPGGAITLANGGIITFAPSTISVPITIGALTITSTTVSSTGNFDVTTGTITATRTALATTSTDGFIAQNTTAATVGVPVQLSPRSRVVGTAWDTDDSVSRTASFYLESLPVSSTTVTGLLRVGWLDPVTGTASSPMTLTSTGTATFNGNIDSTGAVTLLSTSTSGELRSAQPGAIVRMALGAGIIGFTDQTRSNFSTVQFGPEASATSRAVRQKKVTGIADNTATDVLTVTVPNANHAATIGVRFLCSTGSTDAFESSRVAEGAVVLARTTGVTTVATVTTLEQAQIATVAAGATLILTYGVTAMTGAAGATQTFTIQATVNDSGNLGSNQCVVVGEVLNSEATGITIA